uniref:Uncharacterized protein n=1 Tax=Rhizophora mucronata TaxID=61149 RepID=A0A2P2NNW8_RHIMU
MNFINNSLQNLNTSQMK